MAEKYKVKISILGKTEIVVEAEDSESAVRAVVADQARRSGDRIDIMAGRLDKFATVKTPTGATVMVNLKEACPMPAPKENDAIADEIAQDIADALTDNDDFGL